MKDVVGGMDLDRRRFLAGCSALGALSFCPPALAANATTPQTARRTRQITIRGRTITYDMITGETPIYLPDGTPGGTIFSMASVEKSGAPDRRPVTFVWNGGPGGATFHLRQHVGPRIFERAATPRGFDYIDNVHSLLDVTDLVFVDAPGTGYSRVFSGAAKDAFWGIREDGEVVANFIATWLARHGRLKSPLYLMGESYGGTRAGQVALALANRPQPIRTAGFVLISPALHGTGDGPARGRKGAHYALPSQAATSWYHRKGDFTSSSLQAVTRAAQNFANGPYREALSQDAPLRLEVSQEIARQVAKFTGLSPEIILKKDLVISQGDYRAMLLGSEGLLLKNFDGRQSVLAPPPGTKMSVLNTAEGYDLHEAIISIIREDAGYKTTAPYARDPGEIGRRWKTDMRGGTEDSTRIIADLMRKDDGLRVLMLSGYYDLTVAYDYQEDSMRKAAIPESRLMSKTFECGHGVYEDEGLRPETTDLTRDFYAGRLPKT